MAARETKGAGGGQALQDEWRQGKPRGRGGGGGGDPSHNRYLPGPAVVMLASMFVGHGSVSDFLCVKKFLEVLFISNRLWGSPKMGLDARKPAFGSLRTAQVQTSLCICSV